MADTKEILTCPACGKKMQKLMLNSLNFNIDICLDGCGGIFLDNREYKKVVNSSNAIGEIQNAIKNKDFTKVDETYKRICPACGMKMIKNSTSLKKEITVDDCYSCGGKFLDNGELDKILNEYSSEEERQKDMADYLRKNMGYEYDSMQVPQNNANQNSNSGLIGNIVKKFFN